MILLFIIGDHLGHQVKWHAHLCKKSNAWSRVNTKDIMIPIFYCLTHTDYKCKRVSNVLCLLCKCSDKSSNALDPCDVFFVYWVTIDLIIELQDSLRPLSISIAIVNETRYAEVLYFFYSLKVVNVRHKDCVGFLLLWRFCSLLLFLFSLALDIQDVSHQGQLMTCFFQVSLSLLLFFQTLHHNTSKAHVTTIKILSLNSYGCILYL